MNPLNHQFVKNQDLLDLRKNAWVDKRPKKLERAMTLAQVGISHVVFVPCCLQGDIKIIYRYVRSGRSTLIVST